MKRPTAIVAALLVTAALFSLPALSNPGTSGGTRTEADLLGKKQVPAEVYYGVQTARALENFQISNFKMNHYPEFVEAYALVKLAAARANAKVGKLKHDRLVMIEKATMNRK